MFFRKVKEKYGSGIQGNGEGYSDFLFLEQFRSLRAKVEYKIDMHKIQVIGVTSSVSGEGKTLTSLNLAQGIASTGRKQVLLVDTDLRKSDLSRRVKIPRRPGLAEYLAGTVKMEQIVRPMDTEGFFLVPTGSEVSSPSEMISGNRFRQFLGEARSRYGVVFLDTPPVIPVADTQSLVDQVDSFLFLYRIGFTPYQLLQKSVAEIGAGKILGVVLNCVETRKESYYQRYYGRYYRQGHGLQVSGSREK